MKAQFATLEALSSELDQMGTHSPEYWDKMVHPVPKSSVVDRIGYLEKYVAGKIILHVGCTGYLDEVLRKSATKCYGIDQSALDRPDFIQFNCDKSHDSTFPKFPGVELVVCGEVLEHLSNPGYFLDDVRATYRRAPLVVTVPNAFCDGGRDWLVRRQRENVNSDHVCYYSYTTLKELLRRSGYTTKAHFWYGGKPYVSEGLIMLAAPNAEE